MQPVGADQDIAACGADMRAAAIEEIGGDAGLVLGEGAEPVPGMDARFAEPRPRRGIDHALQPAAMDGELRIVEAGIGAARFAPDFLAEPVAIEQLIGADRDRIEPVQQAELRQLLDGVRQRIDPDPELADLVGLLEHLAVDAASLQHQRRGQPANPAADDDRLHTLTLTLPNHPLSCGLSPKTQQNQSSLVDVRRLADAGKVN